MVLRIVKNEGDRVYEKKFKESTDGERGKENHFEKPRDDVFSIIMT